MDNENKLLEQQIIDSINQKEHISAENIRKASNIGYKNIPDKIVHTDQFGFLSNESKR
jgi:hypothetical protein